MKMSAGEVFDRWTILRMKARLSDEMKAEHQRYCAEIAENNELAFLELLAELVEANAKIWMLEADIRNGKEMPLEEVGRRALLIRDHNRLRVQAKGEIDRMFGDTPDIKVDHAAA